MCVRIQDNTQNLSEHTRAGIDLVMRLISYVQGKSGQTLERRQAQIRHQRDIFIK